MRKERMKEMKRFFRTGMWLMLLICLLSTSALAAENKETDTTNGITGEEAAYDSELIDWESIDEIVVFYYTGNDPFIADALERGIRVVFEENAMVSSSRAYVHFSSLSWISRDGVRSLSMVPIHPYTIDKEAAWNEAWRYFEHHPMYTEISNPTKFDSMYNQFVCHADFARGLKLPWNIEPERADKGYWGFVADKCN